MSTIEKKKRIHWLDTARALAMLLVVWGHAMTGDSPVGQWVYAFHVPALFFLSGLVFRRDGKGFGAFLWKKARRILAPYFFFGLVSILIYAVLGRVAADSLGVTDGSGDYSVGKNLLGLLYGSCKGGWMKWNLPLWFLPCLFLMELFQYGGERLCPRRGWLLLPVWLAAGYFFPWAGLPFGLETAVKLYPFFLLGALLRSAAGRLDGLGLRRGLRPAVLLAGAGFTGLGLWLGLMNRRVIYTADVYGEPLLFFAGAVCGTLGLLLLCAGAGRCRWTEYAGQHTVTVLGLHKFPIVFCQMLLPGLTAGAWGALGLSIAVYGACLAADRVIVRWFPFVLGGWYKKK